MDIDSSKMRRHENTSSSEEDDLVDLLGNTYQVILKTPVFFFKRSITIYDISDFVFVFN